MSRAAAAAAHLHSTDWRCPWSSEPHSRVNGELVVRRASGRGQDRPARRRARDAGGAGNRSHSPRMQKRGDGTRRCTVHRDRERPCTMRATGGTARARAGKIQMTLTLTPTPSLMRMPLTVAVVAKVVGPVRTCTSARPRVAPWTSAHARARARSWLIFSKRSRSAGWLMQREDGHIGRQGGAGGRQDGWGPAGFRTNLRMVARSCARATLAAAAAVVVVEDMLKRSGTGAFA